MRFVHYALRMETKEQNVYTQTFEISGCENCGGCEHKAHYLYKYSAKKDSEKYNVMKVNKRWEKLKEESHVNVQSERGIQNRQIRFIQMREILEISKKTRISGVFTTVHPKNCTKSLCCIRAP